MYIIIVYIYNVSVVSTVIPNSSSPLSCGQVSRPPLSCSPLSSTGRTGGHRGHQLLPYGMRPAQLRWQKDVSYDERGNILSITRLDPTKFPSHRHTHAHTLMSHY